MNNVLVKPTIETMKEVSGLVDISKEDKAAKRQERERTISILAHSIATQVAAVENITYREAFGVLGRVENMFKYRMEAECATAPKEIRDKWGNLIEPPDTEVPGD